MFIANHFNQTLEQLRENLLLPQEFVLLAKSKPKYAKGPVLPWIDEHSLESYALSLGKEELESCLLELFAEAVSQRKLELLRILEIRMSSRLIRLIWAFAQYDYERPTMREVAALAASSPVCTEELLEMLFTQEQAVIPAAVLILCREGGELYPFIAKYHILEESPLAKALLTCFFQQARDKDFLINEAYFLELIETASEENLKLCLINYLEQSWLHFSSRRINRALFNRLGMPEEQASSFWKDIAPALIAKYKQWLFCEIMEEHFGMGSKKNSIFGAFYRDLQQIHIFEDGNILVLDFGQFGIINIRERADYAYLMAKTALEMEMENLKDGRELYWLQRRLPIEARDVIIEEKSSDILLLNFAGIGKLFVQELTEELLRKEEGVWPIHFKQAISRFKETAR